MPDSQRYPLNFHLCNIEKDIGVCRSRIQINSVSFLSCVLCKFPQIPFIKVIKLKLNWLIYTKTIFSILDKAFEGYHWESEMQPVPSVEMPSTFLLYNMWMIPLKQYNIIFRTNLSLKFKFPSLQHNLRNILSNFYFLFICINFLQFSLHLHKLFIIFFTIA